MVDQTGQSCPVSEKPQPRKRHATGRVSREQWLEAALSALAQGGVAAVRVDALAKSLSISRSGFYWHFADRGALLDEMKDYWAGTFTESVARQATPEESDPRGQLYALSELIQKSGANQYDLAFWSWARSDPDVAVLVERVAKFRDAHVRGLIAALGFSGDDLEARTRLFVTYHSWGSTMYGDRPASEAAARRIVDVIVATA